MSADTEGDRMSLIERDLIAQAVAAYLPGAVRRERVENMLRALDAAGYKVVPKSDHPRGAVEALRELYEAGLELADLIGSDDAYRRWELAMDAARPAVGGQ